MLENSSTNSLYGKDILGNYQSFTSKKRRLLNSVNYLKAVFVSEAY